MPQLTGVRALAAFMVYLHHMPFMHPFAMTDVAPAWLLSFTAELHVGVNLFFVLSGFLIYYRYAASATLTRGWWRVYLTNRVGRIYPMYFLLTAVTLVLLGQFSPLLWLVNLTFARGFSSQFVFSGIGQGWSLTVEECFYFLAPLLFLSFRKRGWFWTPLAFIYAGGAILALAGKLAGVYGFFYPIRFVIAVTFFGRAFEFFAGMFVARLLIARRTTDAAPLRPFATYGALCALCGMIVVLSRMQTSAGDLAVNHPLGLAANNLAMPVIFAMLLWGLVTERSALRTLLSLPFVLLLGRASYVFYLVHMGAIRNAIQSHLPVMPQVATVAVMFVTMNIVAVVLFRLVEEPFNRRFRRLATRPTVRRRPGANPMLVEG